LNAGIDVEGNTSSRPMWRSSERRREPTRRRARTRLWMRLRDI